MIADDPFEVYIREFFTCHEARCKAVRFTMHTDSSYQCTVCGQRSMTPEQRDDR